MRTFLGALYALALAVALLDVPAASIIARVLLVISIAPGVACLARGLAGAERTWAAALGWYSVAISVSAVAVLYSAPQEELARQIWADLGRQLFLVSVCFLLALSLRHAGARRGLLLGLSIFAVSMLAVVLWTYARYSGDTGNSEAAFKEYARGIGISTNSLAYAGVLSALVAYPAWGRRWPTRFIVGIPAFTVLVISGARSMLASIALSAVAIAVARITRSMHRFLRAALYVVVLAACSVVAFVVGDLGALINPQSATAVTTGRYDVWIAAGRTFLDSPIFGAGAGAWRYDLIGYLPDYYEWGREALVEAVGSGGYHSAYLAALAERGLVGALGAVVLIASLIRLAGSGRDKSFVLFADDARFARLAPFLLGIVLFRGISEQGGLLGNADGVVDFVSYALAANCVAMVAVAERQEQRRPARPSHTRPASPLREPAEEPFPRFS